MKKDVILTLVTVPDQETADRIASSFVEKRLAACVNILKGITSVYRWQDEICRDDEFLLLIKTTRNSFEQLESHVKAIHPYDLPEIIAVEIADGLETYLDWIAAETGKIK